MFPGPARKSEIGEVILGKPIYLTRHRITSARQTITVAVSREPGHVGVDPRALLVDVRPRDNFVDVAVRWKDSRSRPR